MPATSVREVFERHLKERLEKQPDLAQKVRASYRFDVTGTEGGTWVVDLTEAPGRIVEGEAPASCTITIAAQDLLDVVNGKLNGQMAFMSGKLKVEGDLSQALKLNALLG